MKWRIVGFWLVVFVGIWLFLDSFGTFSFHRQEEVQLFIPEWGVIREMLSVPGGFCMVVGQAFVQYYASSLFVLWVNSFFLCSIGFICYLILQEIVPHEYHLLLALFPVFGLLKAHINPFYVLDGTVGILLFLLFLYGGIRIKNDKWRMVYGVISVVFLYGLSGQLAALYGLAVVFLEWVSFRKNKLVSLVVCLLGGLLAYIGCRISHILPLTDGIYSLRFQEAQMQPDSLIYYVWIRFTCLLFVIWGMAFVLKNLLETKRLVKIFVVGGLLVFLFLFSSYCLPGIYEVENVRLDEWDVHAQMSDWDEIIDHHRERKSKGNIGLTYLNWALAQKGMLADSLFHYDQQGVQSLLAPWNKTYYMSCLLSDIHYALGDISLSEGYAMEGLTLAKRGGSPRMLQRLVKINLIRRNLALADKYISLLGRLPNYRHWSEKYVGYIHHPKRIEEDEELGAKRIPAFQSDNLLCLVDIDSLWFGHLLGSGANRIVWEYLGCYYLLSKDMEKFKTFLKRSDFFLREKSIPVHFQEAALVLAVDDQTVLDYIDVRSAIVERYKLFQKDIQKISNSSDGLSWLYRYYGDTFWYYFFCKKLKV